MGIPSTPPVSQTPPANDQANAVVAGAFAVGGITGAAAFSPSFSPWGPFNLTLFGTSTAGPNGNWSGSVQLERQLDGTNWVVCGIGGGGQQAVWNTANQDVSVIVSEPEKGVNYRLHCTALTVGPLNYRMSQTGGVAAMLAGGAVI